MPVTDRRKSARSKLIDTALIRFGDASVCCVVLDLSGTGAALQIGAQMGVPDQFTRLVPQSKIYSCNVIWRKQGRVGVSSSERSSENMVRGRRPVWKGNDT